VAVTDDPGGERKGGGTSPHLRRLLLGLLFMALLLASTLASAFLLGRPGEGSAVAPGVPVLVLTGGAVIVAAAVVFYRTFPKR
jgi:uncharacterized RDD family membrane protein YckC